MLAPSVSPRPRTIEDLMGAGLIARLDRLDVLSRKVFAGKLPGERRSKKRGQSIEFDDYRAYVPGDDLRHIDWNVLARLDRFFVKLFREEEDLALHLVIDASGSMDAGGDAERPSKLVFAQRLAMALGYIGLVNQNRVIASVIGAPGRPMVQQLSAVRGRGNVKRLARFVLENVRAPAGGAEVREGEGAGAMPFTRSLRQIASSRTGRGVMVVLSDFLVREDLPAALNYLGASRGGGGGGGGGGGFDVYCLQVLSPGEIDPAKAGEGFVGDLRLTDVETGAGAEVTISAALLKRYRRRLDEFVSGLRSACAARGITHALVSSDEDVGAMVTGSLRKRGLVG